jgi:UDP-3-O-[3-hydroxymyristoyl] glucosamine N-acyltransferase
VKNPASSSLLKLECVIVCFTRIGKIGFIFKPWAKVQKNFKYYNVIIDNRLDCGVI